MKFWRICRDRYASAAATGEGARLYGGRWNSPGVRAVYTSTSLALAALEIFVNLEPLAQPLDLVSIEGEIPNDLTIARIDLLALPPRWRGTRQEALRKAGDEWIRTGATVALLVPSAAIAGEWNLLLNPLHVDFRKVRFENPVPFVFDQRMFR